MSKRTYYNGPDAVVTDQLFIWHTNPRRSYAVRDLHHVGVTRAASRPASPMTVLMAAAGTVAAVSAGWTLFEPPAAYAVLLLAVTVPLACVLPATVRRPRGWELHALYRGSDVVLYACSEERQFNQVKRALRRSLEAARPPERGLDLAAA
ncbi:DUF6232 family protein [Actinoplanes sp. TRM 88003]|uniref:DUF6232 family protein n=1 Tax=Paractinoplanes aksuensis TaxID=2939490 RepID=A0ABT1DRA5_9ACTN|nr:DUF6232 family protein [Actinoplanes aksuensis]MCO8273360.1 DUF6232 family protein [Actinoplanes aksuensis]